MRTAIRVPGLAAIAAIAAIVAAGDRRRREAPMMREPVLRRRGLSGILCALVCIAYLSLT